MPLKVYIAGPYSSGDPHENVNKAIDAANLVAERGHIPYIPHLNHYWHERHPHSYQFWIDQDNAWLPQCDVLLRLPGDSPGADMEVELAEKHALIIIYDVSQLPIERPNSGEARPFKHISDTIREKISWLTSKL